MQLVELRDALVSQKIIKFGVSQKMITRKSLTFFLFLKKSLKKLEKHGYFFKIPNEGFAVISLAVWLLTRNPIY